eukprot:scaffold14678_cov97-Cylindrotheca_fusiformis.AAC.2
MALIARASYIPKKTEGEVVYSVRVLKGKYDVKDDPLCSCENIPQRRKSCFRHSLKGTDCLHHYFIYTFSKASPPQAWHLFSFFPQSGKSKHEAKDVWVYTGQGEVPATARNVLIAENITRIPDHEFQQHQELEEVVLSSSVREIGKFNFYGCKKLKFIFHYGLGQEKKLGTISVGLVVFYWMS